MNVIITGSSKGIGLALAEEFAKYNDHIIISARNQELIDEAVLQLRSKYPEAVIYGTICDVSKSKDIEDLAKYAIEKLESIDLWVNNAGTTAYMYDKFLNFSDEELKLIVDTNLIGTLFGCREALKVMSKQGFGHIFNLAGFGASGGASPNLAAYGSTKCAINQLTTTLAKENKKSGIGFHILQPGMTLTDLFLKNVSPEAAKIFNILGDTTENVTKFLVPRMRKIKGTGKKINYLSNTKAFWRFMTAGFRKNRFFDKEGNLIKNR